MRLHRFRAFDYRCKYCSVSGVRTSVCTLPNFVREHASPYGRIWHSGGSQTTMIGFHSSTPPLNMLKRVEFVELCVIMDAANNLEWHGNIHYRLIDMSVRTLKLYIQSINAQHKTCDQQHTNSLLVLVDFFTRANSMILRHFALSWQRFFPGVQETEEKLQ